MASAGSNVTVITALTKLFNHVDDGGFCTEFFVGVRSASSFPLLVNVPGLHKDGEFVGVPIGASITFRLGQTGLARVFAKGDGGNAEIDFGVVSKAWDI